MTKTDLQDYRAARSRLEEIETELARLESRICVQSAATPPYSKHSATMCGLPPSDEVTALHREKAALERRTAAVRAFISAIPDPQTREMFELKYLKGKTFLQVAMAIGLGGNESCVKMRIYRQLRKL